MSAPNLIVWLPCVRVQLFTNWNCCSLSVSGQLQRPMFNPSPNEESVPFPEPAPPPFSVKLKPGNPPVVGGPTMPGPEFNPGKPSLSAGVAFASEYAVCGLYLKYPKRKSVSHLLPIGLVNPLAKL